MPQPDLRVIEGPSRRDLKDAAGDVWPVFGEDLRGGITRWDGDRHVGPYILLLMALWYEGGELPNVRYKLAQIAMVSERRFARIWEVISEKFEVTETTVSHHRVTKMLHERYRFVYHRRTAGKQGGQAKALKDKERGLASAKPRALASLSHEEIPNGISSGPTKPKSDPPKKTRRKPAKPLPDDWVPDLDQARNLMDELDLTRAEMNYCYQRMKAHAQQSDRRIVNWDAAYANWVRKARRDGEVGPDSRGRKAEGGAGIFPDTI